jgi:hypothetical protein
MDDNAELEESIRGAFRRAWVQPPGDAFTVRVMGALPTGSDRRGLGRLTLLGAAALSAILTIALVRTVLLGSTPIPGASDRASGPGDSPAPISSEAVTAPPISTVRTVAMWELLVPQPAGWLAVANGTRADFTGQKLYPVGSLGDVTVRQECGYDSCTTSWDDSAEIQVRIEHVARPNTGWGQWGMASREAPPGAERITIDGIGAQVRVVDGDRVPDTEEIVAGATRIIVWDLPTPGNLWMSYRITAVIRGGSDRVETLAGQVTQMVEGIEYSPSFGWDLPADDPLGALAAGLRALRDLASRSETLDASCFPDEPGTSPEIVIEKAAFLPYELTQPLKVTCSSAIERTEFRRWKMTLRYDWQATDEYAAGHAEMVVLLDKMHGVVGYYGNFFGVDDMPYLQHLPAAP